MPKKNYNSTALILRYDKMGIPEAIASDDGGEFDGRFKDILDAEDITHITMIIHVSFIDCFTRTSKICYLKELNAFKKTGIYCFKQ